MITKYLKSFIISIVPALVLTFIISILYYFNIIDLANNYIKYIIMILSLFTGSIYLGLNIEKNGWLEGLKFGLLFTIIYLIISLFIFKYKIVLKSFIYYFVLIITSILGSMIGISRKKVTE